MQKDRVLTQQQFDDLLNWLSADREKAGDIYLIVSERLTCYFRVKGCHDIQSLVDETINRVARRLHTIDVSDGYKPIQIFYGFAKNVHFEYLGQLQRSPLSLDLSRLPDVHFSNVDDNSEHHFHCLDGCVSTLDEKEVSLVTSYFESDRHKKVQSRREIASRLNISPGTLHLRIHRLKGTLRECLEKCLESL